MIGIVILNYINWEDTVQCIKSILESECRVHYHIYFIDNDSPNNMPDSVRELLQEENISFFKSVENRGYSAGNNIGIKKALLDGCDSILVTNNDVRFEKNSIDRMHTCLTSSSDIGIVGPKVLNENGEIQKNNLYMHTGLCEKYLVRTKLNIFFRRKFRKYFGLDLDYNCNHEAFAVSGCCYMMGRECAETITPFDENVFLYDEELIIGLEMQRSGYKTLYISSSTISHLQGNSTKNVKAFSFIKMVCSEVYYCRYYLKAENWKIYPLYWYRVLLYIFRCFKYNDFRKNWVNFRKETKSWFVY